MNALTEIMHINNRDKMLNVKMIHFLYSFSIFRSISSTDQQSSNNSKCYEKHIPIMIKIRDLIKLLKHILHLSYLRSIKLENDHKLTTNSA